MRHQQAIYIQNENRAVRNKDILNVNMSSDFCVFESPRFDIDETTKVQCDSVICYLTGYSLTNILTAATNTCLSGLSSSLCYTGTTWQTKVYENNLIAYSANFYTTTTTGVTPSNESFLNSVTGALTTLGYTYIKEDNKFTINKKGDVKQLKLDICVLFGIKTSNFSCPAGFSATPSNDSCQKIEVSAATFNGSGSTIVAGDKNGANFGIYGTYFYPEIQNNGALPLYYAGGLLKNQSGGTITALNINNTSSFWASLGSTANGRLNNIGLKPLSSEYVGFTSCFNISSGGTYYVGLAADNYCRFSVNGRLIVNFSGTVQENFRIWSVFPITLNSGKNIIEMFGKDDGATTAAFGAEIYSPINYTTLTGATDTGLTQANVIFSTSGFVGKTWELGTSVGYSCPSTYSLDNCSGTYTCSKITYSAITGITCSASCSGTCTTVCSHNFPYIDNNSSGVNQLDGLTATSLSLTFNFTANTNVFTANTTNFKYEIYKYNNDLNVFTVPCVYSSDTISYSAFSGTNILQQSIPLSGLSLDGDYIVKGYYESNACTDFLNRLGKKIDTSIYKNGSEYQLYDSNIDYYFIATTKADVPIFNQTGNNVLYSYNALPLYQQVILVDSDSGNTYNRTGTTFALESQYLGDVLVTLNGLTLGKGVDYTLSGVALTFIGDIRDGDIISIIYTRTSSLTLVGDTIQINSTIPQGTTNNQGTNKYYYNTTTGKYEIYLENDPIDNSEIIVILNGATLLNNIDYYRSTTDSNRVILNGVIYIDDIITVIYYPKTNVIGGINKSNNTIAWYIPTVPQKANGNFYLEYGTNSSFTNSNITDAIPYVPLVTNYTTDIILTGNVGDKIYYRVKNIKEYESMCGDKIKSTAYSETIRVTVQTNSINSY